MEERKTRRLSPARNERNTEPVGRQRSEARESLDGVALSHYEILEKLGHGGMGVVYKARDLRLNRFVAIKLLSPATRPSEKSHQRFLQEARAASSIDHPNTCTVYELDETEDGRLFLVMALYEGETLAQRIGRGPLGVEEAVSIAHDAACGLAKAHEMGIVHRDIKPSNLMITRDGMVKILDFGIAKLAGAAALTRSGRILGSIDYMSPEQAQGHKVDHRTDVWSLGVVLFEMLTGRKPFHRDNDRLTFQAIVFQDPPPLDESEWEPSWRQEIPALLARALAKAPGERYSQIREMADALAALLPGSASRLSSSRSTASRRVPQASIVVLPFTDLSPERDQEYFCDGLAEDLIHVLGKIDGLRVASRTSTFQLKGRQEDVHELCERLSVAHYLSGGIRRAGSRIRVTAQLVRASDECQLWSGRYDREVEDVFALQDEIASTIVETLRPKLLGGDGPKKEEAQPRNFETYNLYLKGRYFWNKRTEAGLKEGAAHFREAIEKDPGYARAWSGLADSYLLLGIYGLEPPREVMPMARAAAERALALDGALADAHASLGCLRALYEWRWREAEAEFQRALALDPQSATAHQWYAVNGLAPQGRFQEAFTEAEQARALDPLSPAIHASVGLLHYFRGDAGAAIATYEQILKMDPGFAMAHFFLGLAQVRQGKANEAVASLEKAIHHSGGTPEMTSALGYAFAVGGDTGRARQELAALEEARERRYVSPVLLAQVHAGLGEAEPALRWLETAWKERSADLSFVAVRPTFARLRETTAFGELLARLDLEATMLGTRF